MQVEADEDFAAKTQDVASVVYLCKEEEDCLSDEVWESVAAEK